MDTAAMDLMIGFRDKYLSDMKGASILDVGSRRVKRQTEDYSQIFSADYDYTGMDIVDGPNVDIVGYDNIIMQYDIVVSGSVMEHVERPWEWIVSLAAYFTKYICIIAPWQWREHRHPIDTFRYMPDGMRSLFNYAGINVLEIIKDSRYHCVGIGEK
jgi:hypothetical protein